MQPSPFCGVSGGAGGAPQGYAGESGHCAHELGNVRETITCLEETLNAMSASHLWRVSVTIRDVVDWARRRYRH